ncbi:VOC family protein [Deinococcus apachensis]|uniref:VOC family protein n=1 Tax=Deinococcus apachensis TaxID=309886 RepID=UPI00035D8179|nr:hypothetical protein [Deinococcus apachensis]
MEVLTLPARDLAAQRAFYGDVLGLPADTDEVGALNLRVGSTLLRFVVGELGGPSHFAFNVPEDRFAGARAWLEERVPLLADPAGETSFHSKSWNADMVYFRDAEGNILELIARHTLPTSPGTGFGVADLLCVSELGLVVPDVPRAVRDLQQRLGLPVYREGSPTFTPLGDEEGLLIVVQAGRGWFPVGDPAWPLPFHLQGRNGDHAFDLKEHP